MTIGWAAEGAAIIALGLHERRDWLRAAGAFLFAVAIVRTLSLLGTVAPANHVVLLNPRAASAVVVVGLSYLLAWLHHRDPDVTNPEIARVDKTGIMRAPVDVALLAAQFVSVVFLTSEIHAFFAVREGCVHPRDDDLRHLGRSTRRRWSSPGCYKRYAPIRYFAYRAVRNHDSSRCSSVTWRSSTGSTACSSIIGLGVLLLVTSYVYQRMRGTLLGTDSGQGEPPRAT